MIDYTVPYEAKELASNKLTEWSACMLVMEQWNFVAEYIIEHTNKKLISRDRAEQLKWEIGRGLGMKVFFGGCAACEYKGSCDDCPIWGYLTYKCTSDVGEFDTYIRIPTSENALAIAYLAEQALDRLDGDL